MSGVIVQLPLDRTGHSPNNLISGEKHPLQVTPGFPYKIFTMDHGGFYVNSLRVYDTDYNRLEEKTDYIVTYEYKNASESTGLKIAGAILMLDKNRTGEVFCSAQMVGGDLCYSFTVVEDYVNFFHTKPINYIPFWLDYVGSEPIWKPGELEKERWGLDTYQPFNNELEKMGYATMGGLGGYEDDYRQKVIDDYDEFMSRFNDRLERHIQDKANPHVDIKSHIAMDLSQVENYKVATATEMRAGTSNELYLTPLLANTAINDWAMTPLNSHKNDKNNPHRLEAAQIDVPIKPTVDATVNNKYLLQERVANANYSSPGGATYTALYNDYRSQIPAGNFAAGGANGYLHPSRYGRGTPQWNRVLLADNQSWIDFDSLCQLYGSQNNSRVYFMSVDPNTSPQQAFSIAMTQPYIWTASMGSMILYNLMTQYDWGAGNGAWGVQQLSTFGCIKTESGWVQI